MRAFFVVNNPTQLLFCLEALHALPRTGAVQPPALLIVRDARAASADELYRQMLTMHHFGPVTTTSSGRQPVRNVGRTLALLARAQHYDAVITPMITYFPVRNMLRIRALRGRSPDVITDDGSWTLEFAAALTSGTPSARATARMLRQLPRELRFFTIYPEVTLRPRDKVTANTMAWTRSHLGGTSSPMRTIVLGTDFVGYGYVTREVYLESLEHLVADAPGPAVYLPHRRETPALLRDIENVSGIPVAVRTHPLEIELARYVGPEPPTIYSMPSTALRTLRVLMGANSDVVLARFPPRVIAEKLRHSYQLMAEACEGDATRSVVLDAAGPAPRYPYV